MQQMKASKQEVKYLNAHVSNVRTEFQKIAKFVKQ